MKWGCIGLLIAMPLGVILRGLVLAQLWGWFLVPLGMVEITLPWALGISTLLNALVGHPVTAEKPDWYLPAKGILICLGNPAFALLGGWLFHSFM